MAIDDLKPATATISNKLAEPREAASHPPAGVLKKISSFPVMMGALLAIGAVLGARFNLPDPDMWWHLAVGRYIWAAHSLPTFDPYSFTVSKAPWIAYEWLGETLMAGTSYLSMLRGPEALLLLLAVVFTLLLYVYATLMSGNSKAAFICCAVMLPVTSVFFTLRPQLIGYILFAITLICLERYRQGLQKNLWVLPLLFLIWVNTHGSFLFGFVAFGIYWVSGLFDFHAGGVHTERWTNTQRRHLALVFLLCVVVLVITPYGTRLAAYPLQMAISQPVNLSHINEWQSLDFQFWQTKLILLLILIFWLAHVLLRMEYRLENAALLLFATYACFVHRRFTPFLILIFVPLLARMIQKWIPPYDPSIDRFAFNTGLILLVAVGIYSAFPSQQKLDETIRDRYPVQAVKYLRAHPVPDRILNEYGWGGYLIWSPDYGHRVFIDGRADFYEYAGVLSDYFGIVNVTPDALFLLRKYDVQACLLHHDAPLATLLAVRPDWKETYQDNVSVVFVHQPGQSTTSKTDSSGLPRSAANAALTKQKSLASLRMGGAAAASGF